MSRWWRAYDDALHNPKVQGMSPVLFKFWFNVLCAASKNEGVIPPLDDLKTMLKARLDHVEAHLNELIKRGLVDEADGKLRPHNWDKRQYKSDSSAERTRTWRSNKRQHCDVTPAVTVTPPDNRVQSTEKKDAPPAPLLGQPTADAELYARGKQILGKSSGGLIAKLVKSKNGNIALARAAIEQASTKQNPSEYIARIVHGTAGSKVDLGDPQDVMRFILS